MTTTATYRMWRFIKCHNSWMLFPFVEMNALVKFNSTLIFSRFFPSCNIKRKNDKAGFFAKWKFRIRKLECLECATIRSFCRGLRIYFKPDVHNFSRFEWISKWAKRKWSFLRISFKESLCCRQKTLWKQSDYFAEMRQHGMKFRNNMRRESNPILYNVHHHVSTHSCIVFLSQFLGDH